MRVVGSLVVLALLGSLASPAEAQSQRIVVEDFEGPGGGSFRASVLRSLRGAGDIALVPREEVYDSARRLGVPLYGPANYVAVARDLAVSTFISGAVQHGRGWRVTLQVRNGANGEIVEETSFAARRAGRVSRAIQRGLWRRVGRSVQSTSAPAAGIEPSRMQALENEAPPPMELDELQQEQQSRGGADLDPELFPDAEGDAGEADGDSGGLFDPNFVSQHSPLEAQLGLRAINRGFRYRDDRSGALQPYDMPFGPELTMGAEWYPGAHVTNGALAHIGLVARVEQSILLSSAGPNDTSYPTSDTYWAIGTRARIPVGDDGRVSFSAAYAHHSYSVEAAHPRDGSPSIGSVDYEHGRFGADARLPMGDLALTLDGAYLLVLDAGEIGDEHWFPRTTAQGMEASLGFIYPLGNDFQLRGSIDGRLYLLDFHTRDGDAMQIGGAIDRFIGATAAIAWRMPGDVD